MTWDVAHCLVINHIKGMPTDRCQSFVTLFFKMAQGSSYKSTVKKRTGKSIKRFISFGSANSECLKPKQYREIKKLQQAKYQIQQEVIQKQL